MEIVKKKISDLRFDPENLRHHGAENIEMIKRSLVEFKQYKPLIIDSKTNVVKIGNGRLKAMIELGWKDCWCVEIDFSKHEGMEILDNRLNELSFWQDTEIDDWLLNDKGVDWWGVDLNKSLSLLEREKKKARKNPSLHKEKKEKVVPACPCCGKPLQKSNLIFQ